MTMTMMMKSGDCLIDLCVLVEFVDQLILVLYLWESCRLDYQVKRVIGFLSQTILAEALTGLQYMELMALYICSKLSDKDEELMALYICLQLFGDQKIFESILVRNDSFKDI